MWWYAVKALPSKLVPGEGYVQCEIVEATHIKIHIPGPFGYLYLPVIQGGTREGTGCWSWNGDVDKPTLKPSIKTTNNTDVCHTWVTDGKAFYHDDTTHEFKGQTLDLIDV